MRVRRDQSWGGESPHSILGFWGLLYNGLRINRGGASNSCARLTVQMFLYINPARLDSPHPTTHTQRTTEAQAKGQHFCNLLLLLCRSHSHFLLKWELYFSIKGFVTKVHFFPFHFHCLVRHYVVPLVGSAFWLSDETALHVCMQLMIGNLLGDRL